MLSLLPEGSPKVTPEMSKDVLAPVKCDKAGNIYFRESGESDEFQEPIVKISADGKMSTRFDARKISGVPKDFVGSDFSADSDGDVYQIILTRAFELRLIHYRPDGTGESKITLHDVLNPVSISVQPLGDLLVADTPLQMGGSENASQLVIAAFDKNGRGKGAKHTVAIRSPFEARFSDDSRLYVSSGGDVTVVSENGETVKQMHLDPNDPALKLSSWYAFASYVVGEFDNGSNASEPFKGMVAIFDATTGNIKKRYRLSEAVRGGLACVSERAFTFLSTEPDGHLSLVTANRSQ
jgi:hypothetical protein